MLDYIEKMKIDDDRIHVLTKYASKTGIKKRVESDHNILSVKRPSQEPQPPSFKI